MRLVRLFSEREANGCVHRGERFGAKAEYDSRRPSSAEGKWSRGLGLFKYADPRARAACLYTRGTLEAAGVRCAESPLFYFLSLCNIYKLRMAPTGTSLPPYQDSREGT